MSIIITNCGPHPIKGGAWHTYTARIRSHKIVTFDHDRSKGFSQCLRDCADAYDLLMIKSIENGDDLAKAADL